jgi:hypothetical protein
MYVASEACKTTKLTNICAYLSVYKIFVLSFDNIVHNLVKFDYKRKS